MVASSNSALATAAALAAGAPLSPRACRDVRGVRPPRRSPTNFAASRAKRADSHHPRGDRSRIATHSVGRKVRTQRRKGASRREISSKCMESEALSSIASAASGSMALEIVWRTLSRLQRLPVATNKFVCHGPLGRLRLSAFARFLPLLFSSFSTCCWRRATQPSPPISPRSPAA